MLIRAQDRRGRVLTEFELGQGEDPAAVLAGRGFRLLRPVEAVGADADVVVRVLAEPGAGRAHGRGRRPARSGRTELPPGVEPVVRQRLAAYAWVESERGILASEFYRPGPAGSWGLPGGGVDPGEEPVAAVHREVLEETGQRIELGELVAVRTRHHIGPDFSGRYADFHAVQLIYRARCPEPTEPVVLDVGGTTTAATWFPPDGWRGAPWMPSWRRLLIDLFADH